MKVVKFFENEKFYWVKGCKGLFIVYFTFMIISDLLSIVRWIVMISADKYYNVFNRPGVAGAVLQTASSLINWVIE